MKLIDYLTLGFIAAILFIAIRYIYKNRKNPCFGCNKCKNIKKALNDIIKEK